LPKIVGTTYQHYQLIVKRCVLNTQKLYTFRFCSIRKQRIRHNKSSAKSNTKASAPL